MNNSSPAAEHTPSSDPGLPAESATTSFQQPETPQTTDEESAKEQARRRRPNHGPGAGMQPGEKAQDFSKGLRRVVNLLRPHKIAVGLALSMSMLSVLAASIGPMFLGRATDIVVAGVLAKDLPAGVSRAQAVQHLRDKGKDTSADMLAVLDFVPGVGVDFTSVATVLLIAAGLFVSAAVLQFVQGWVINNVIARTAWRLRSQVEKQVHSLPLAYFDRQPRGEVLSRVTNDVDNLQQSMTQAFSQLLNSVFTVVFVLVMMLRISLALTAVSVIAIPLAVFISQRIMSRSRPRFAAQWRHTGQLNSIVEESFTGHEIVTVFGRRAEMSSQFTTANDALMHHAYRAQFISGMMMPIMGFVGNLSYVVVAVIGGLKVASGSLTIGDVQAFIQYSRQFTQPMSHVASLMNLLQSGTASAERVFELLDESPERPSGTKHLPAQISGRVVFSQVSFGYDGKQVLHEVNLVAEPGQTVAIVGPTGAGKTTLVHLLMRLYECDSGTITIDGVDIAQVPRSQVRQQMGMVLQDTWLFAGTIAENISYGRVQASPAQVQEAAKAAYVDRFVRSLPAGYDTLLSDSAENLSSGEKQLIAIARAFVRQPAILILDEATSSVDTRTEVQVQQAMSALRRGRTSFVIAHRLSTIRQADQIVVIDDGRIVEQGTHSELMAGRGQYYGLTMSQFIGQGE